MAIRGADNLRFTLIVLVLTVGGPCFGQAPVDARSVQAFFDSWATYRADYEVIYQEQDKAGFPGRIVSRMSGFVEIAPEACHSLLLQATGVSVDPQARSLHLIEFLDNRQLRALIRFDRRLATTSNVLGPEFLPSTQLRSQLLASPASVRWISDEVIVRKQRKLANVWFPFSRFVPDASASATRLAGEPTRYRLRGKSDWRSGEAEAVLVVDANSRPVAYEKPLRARLIEASPDGTEQTWRTDREGTTATFHWTNIQQGLADCTGLRYPPPNGTRVYLDQDVQIQAEWRDGEIVRVYNQEAVESLQQVALAPPAQSPWFRRTLYLIGCAVVLAGLAQWYFRRRRGPVR